MERQQDIALGTIVAAFGLWAAYGATAYDGASGTYPMVLGILLTLTGLIVVGRALRSNKQVERVLMNAPTKLFTAIAIGATYVALVVPLGFYSASFLLMIALPWALGFRRPAYALVVGTVFISLVYLVFSVLLERPLPRELMFSVFGAGG